MSFILTTTIRITNGLLKYGENDIEDFLICHVWVLLPNFGGRYQSSVPEISRIRDFITPLIPLKKKTEKSGRFIKFYICYDLTFYHYSNGLRIKTDTTNEKDFM